MKAGDPSMSREALKYLYDISVAAQKVHAFTEAKQFADYQGDDLLRSAVERQFEIIGEALNQLSRREPDVCQKITGYRRAIAFRNILIHGYAEIDDEVVWRVLKDDLPVLFQDVLDLLASDEK